MAITGRSIAAPAAAMTTETKVDALVDAVVSLRKRLAMEQELQVDSGDIDTDDTILNAERTS